MSVRRQHRAAPEVPPSTASVTDRPRLRPALGGRRGDGEPARAAAAGGQLWLAIHLPHYVIESLAWPERPGTGGRSHAGSAPRAVVDAERDGKVVRACDVVAAAAGITPGMALNSALALSPALRVQARDARRERALLEAVAAVAGSFTPRVNLEPPDGVLLEVHGSLRLFGGVRRLHALALERLQSLGVAPWLAIAPTPLASLWFARTGEEVVLRRPDAVASRLAPLPLACTRWPERSLQALATMGVRTVGDCLKLPREGFARRFEPEMLRALDRAVGRAPDPRTAFVARERFTARRDLEPEAADLERLQRALEPLLAELCAFLRQRVRGVEVIDLRFVHRAAPETRVRLRFVEPATQDGHIAELLRERLGRVVLPEPVRTVHLRSGPLVEVHGHAADLFALRRNGAAGAPQLIERLRARLGAEAVQGICLVPEHRPEAAWIGDIHRFSRLSPVLETSGKIGECPHLTGECPPRPLWLLLEPRLLAGEERPRCEGALELEAGPERIESGWWDGRDVRRDYYVARTPAGVRLWVFRERDAGRRWFLHGVFG